MQESLARALPESLARVAAAPSVPELSGPVPSVVEAVRRDLEAALGLQVMVAPASGPSYVIEEGVVFPPTTRLTRSDAADADLLRGANPGNWEADAWHDLLDGRLGAWVMAVESGRVVSICHTPVCNAGAAEAGVWTDPACRGRGYAAACTAEWATLMRPTRRALFYSTSRTNRASQAVARRLGLRFLGCMWQLRTDCDAG